MSNYNFKTKYDRLKHDLETTGSGSMKCFGPSMMPILSTASTCFYEVKDDYNVGDIVFCKVKGRWIDSHLITQKADNKWMISNNHGHNNGWTNKIYGKVVKAIDKSGKVKTFK